MTESERAPAGDRSVFDVLVLAIGDDAASPVAIPAAAVREVARIDGVTPYPGAPVDVSGVTSVRGLIVPVLSLAPGDVAARAAVVIAIGTGVVALGGASPVRVVPAHDDSELRRADVPAVRLWSGRLLPTSGAVRLHDAAPPDAGGAVLPLLDAAALIGDVVDDSDGGR